MILSWTATADSALPKHRGPGITISEFARNFNDYEAVLETQSEYIMITNGLWKKVNSQNVIIITGDENHVRPNFSYAFDGSGYVRKIQYKDHWYDAQFPSPIPTYCGTALYAILGSRPGCNYRGLVKAESLISSEILNKLIESVKGGSFYGSFQINDVYISRQIDAKNCDVITDTGWLMSFGDETWNIIIFLILKS